MNIKKHLLNPGGRFPCFTHIIFDLDQTLYWSKKFKEATSYQAVQCIADTFEISFEKAKHLLQKKRSFLRINYGYTPALSTTLRELEIPLKKWADYQGSVDIDKIIVRDDLVINLIEKFHSKYSLLLYTNMCRFLTSKVISKLGLNDFFQVTLTPQDTNSTKPDQEVLRSLEEEGLLRIITTLSVGDRYEIDIAPVCELGGWGYIVSKQEKLLELLNILRLEAIK